MMNEFSDEPVRFMELCHTMLMQFHVKFQIKVNKDVPYQTLCASTPDLVCVCVCVCVCACIYVCVIMQVKECQELHPGLKQRLWFFLRSPFYIYIPF